MLLDRGCGLGMAGRLGLQATRFGPWARSIPAAGSCLNLLGESPSGIGRHDRNLIATAANPRVHSPGVPWRRLSSPSEGRRTSPTWALLRAGAMQATDD